MNWLKIAVGLICIIISAYVSFSIPVTESGIPFTAQSLVVFVVAAMMNTHEVKVCMLSYLFLGIVGLPVFAEGTAGMDKIMGPSGGFLYGFVFAGWFISEMIADFKPMKVYHLLIIFLAATFVLFFFGLGHLALKFDLESALKFGLYPFWKMALFKALLAALVTVVIRRDIIG